MNSVTEQSRGENGAVDELHVFSYDTCMFSIRYFFNNPPIRTRELIISGLGIQEVMPSVMVNRPQGTGDYLLMVFFDDVMFTANDGSALRKAGTIVLWSPESAHYYGRTSAPWRHSWVHCHGTRVPELIRRTGMVTDTPITLSDPYICDKYLLDLHIELTGRATPDIAIASNILENWLREIVRMRKGQKTSRMPETIATTRAYLESHYADPINLAGMARQAHISVPHLCALYKKHCGVSVMAYVIKLRLAKAQHLIQDTAMPIGQVAQAVGYDDLFHFSKLFKKHYGMAPTTMREKKADISVL